MVRRFIQGSVAPEEFVVQLVVTTSATSASACADHVSSRGRSGKVRRMFAHSIQNWWWTAHPAAH
jgi:hypothetical protein